MEEKLKIKLGKRELTWLKQKAREVGIAVDCTQTDSQQLYTLSEKLAEIGRNDILEELKTKGKKLLLMPNPMCWNL